MTTLPVGDGRGSPLPTAVMIATRISELCKRRGLMATVAVLDVGFPAIFLAIRLVAHALAPFSNPPAGGDQIFTVLVAGFLPMLGFIIAVTIGCTAGSRDLSEGVFRHLVVTGRSRLALYLARVPAGVAIVMTLVATGYVITCAVCCLAAPSAITYDSVPVPAGLSRAGFEAWAGDHAVAAVCEFPYNGQVPATLDCPHGAWSVSSVAPAQPAPAALDALAVKIAGDDYQDYAGVILSPSTSLMVEAGLWLELGAGVGYVIGLGLSSLMGQRTVPLVLLIIFQLIATPILSVVDLPHLLYLQRSVIGVAIAHLKPGALPLAFGVPGVYGGMARSGPGMSPPLPEPTTDAILVVIAWLAVWTALGAWRMMTRDA
jgi:hypothetical protein